MPNFVLSKQFRDQKLKRSYLFRRNENEDEQAKEGDGSDGQDFEGVGHYDSLSSRLVSPAVGFFHIVQLEEA